MRLSDRSIAFGLPVVSRRAALGLGLGVVAWACSGSKKDKSAPPSLQQLSVVAVSTEIAVGDRRFAFALFENDNRPFRPATAASLPYTLRFADGSTKRGEATPESIRLGTGGDQAELGSETHTIYRLEEQFTVVGIGQLTARVGEGERASTVRLAFEVTDDSASPRVGEKAVSVKSPTVADPAGVDPVCTRVPACSMHDVSIDAALAAARPLVVVFSTPQYCTSRTCGPAVDIVETAKAEVGDQAAFVHVEVWKDRNSIGKVPAPAFGAWGFQAEPWLYFVGSDGIVKDRWSGAIGADETQRAARDLVAGKM
jgi:hypothetical protein